MANESRVFFSHTPLGGALLLLLLRAIGVWRTLDRMSRNFRSGNNFSEVSSKVVGDRRVELYVNDVFSPSPEYMRGLLVEGIKLTGATARVEVLSHVGDTATLLVSWD